MKKATLAFIDLETTGTNPQKHEIIEIGCVLAKQTGLTIEKADEFDIKVKPTRIEDAETEALRVNRYSESDWLFASDLKDALTTLSEKTRDAIMIAQNVTFDWAFLNKAYSDVGMEETINYHKLDLASIAVGKLHNEDIQKFTMRGLCEYLGVRNENAHTALSDARAAFEVYKKLIER